MFHARLFLFMELTIRPVDRNDLAAVVNLIREFAAFEDLSQYCEVTVERLDLAMFSGDGVVKGLIAMDGEVPIGYALFFANFSSFRGQRGLYLDDIYVKEAYRGKGVGEAILKQIAADAAARGLERIDFLVLDWNKPATAFYKKLGAADDPDERHYKFTDDAFRKLAG